MFACFGGGPGALEGITSVSKPKLLLEFRKIGFVLSKEPSRNYRLYIYMMIFSWLALGPREFGCVLSSRSGTTAGSNGAVEATLMAYRFYQQLWGRGSGVRIVSGGLIIGRRGLRYRSRQSGWGLTFDRRW
jgi:hypothetical protein